MYKRELPSDQIENSEGTHVDGEDSHSEDEHAHDHGNETAANNEKADFDDYDGLDEAIDLGAVTITSSVAASAMDKNAVGLQLNITEKELLKAA